MFGKKGSKILKLFRFYISNDKLVVIINSFKVPKIEKLLLYEISCTKLQLPPERLTRALPPQIPILSVLCPQLNLLKPSHRTKFLGTPLIVEE